MGLHNYWWNIYLNIICVRSYKVCKHQWTMHRKCLVILKSSHRVRGTVYNARGKWDFQLILNSYFCGCHFNKEFCQITALYLFCNFLQLQVMSRSPLFCWPLPNSLVTKLQFSSLIERCSNDCRKTKTKSIAPTNHNRSRQYNEPITNPSNHQ